jgi:eukaryotic-like serine/threonine-protein kinase
MQKSAKKILLHLGLIVAVIALSLFGTMKFLDAYTEHGEFVEVPDYRGQRTTQLETFTEGKDVNYEIIDSIYDPREKAGLVLRQDPDPGSRVKHNRKVYLYVTCQVPPKVALPMLVDRSERQAKFIIETYGLKMGRTEYEKADCNGCVIAQSVRGSNAKPGDPVKKGSVVNIVVGTKDAFFVKDSVDTDVN